LIFDLLERASWRVDLVLEGGLVLDFLILIFSFETDSIRREDIIHGFFPYMVLPWLGAYFLCLFSLFFSLDICFMKRLNKEKQEDN